MAYEEALRRRHRVHEEGHGALVGLELAVPVAGDRLDLGQRRKGCKGGWAAYHAGVSGWARRGPGAGWRAVRRRKLAKSLYRHRSLQADTRFSAFFKIYNMIVLTF